MWRGGESREPLEKQAVAVRRGCDKGIDVALPPSCDRFYRLLKQTHPHTKSRSDIAPNKGRSSPLVEIRLRQTGESYLSGTTKQAPRTMSLTNLQAHPKAAWPSSTTSTPGSAP